VKARASRAERRVAVLAQLLEAVERLLAEGEAFGDLSVDRLAQEAGISRSKFYLYFEDKGDLLRAWFASVTDDIVDAARAWWALGEDGGPIDRAHVRAALAGIVRTYRPHVRLMAATYAAAEQDPAVRELTDGLITVSVAGLRKHLRTGRRDGWVDPALHVEQTAQWLTWMAERGLHQLAPGATDAEVERLVEAYTDIVWKTLYLPRPA
jgi:TetR/AcrR family transcriptional regulator, ethionamide resistance regulator